MSPGMFDEFEENLAVHKSGVDNVKKYMNNISTNIRDFEAMLNLYEVKGSYTFYPNPDDETEFLIFTEGRLNYTYEGQTGFIEKPLIETKFSTRERMHKSLKQFMKEIVESL